MQFEDYVKEELEKLNGKVDQLMIFMAVKQAEDAKTNKHTAVIVGAVVSIVVSTASYVLQKFL